MNPHHEMNPHNEMDFNLRSSWRLNTRTKIHIPQFTSAYGYTPTLNNTTTRKHNNWSSVILGRRSLSEPKHLRCEITIPTTSKNLSSKIWNNEFTSWDLTSWQRFTYHNSHITIHNRQWFILQRLALPTLFWTRACLRQECVPYA